MNTNFETTTTATTINNSSELISDVKETRSDFNKQWEHIIMKNSVKNLQTGVFEWVSEEGDPDSYTFTSLFYGVPAVVKDEKDSSIYMKVFKSVNICNDHSVICIINNDAVGFKDDVELVLNCWEDGMMAMDGDYHPFGSFELSYNVNGVLKDVPDFYRHTPELECNKIVESFLHVLNTLQKNI